MIVEPGTHVGEGPGMVVIISSSTCDWGGQRVVGICD